MWALTGGALECVDAKWSGWEHWLPTTWEMLGVWLGAKRAAPQSKPRTHDVRVAMRDARTDRE